MPPMDIIHEPARLNTQWSSVTPVLGQGLWSSKAQNKLKELADLPENWNGYGSSRIRQSAIDTAMKLLTDLGKGSMPEPLIFPVSGGGVQFEWHNAGSELEIEILPNNSIEFLIVDPNGKMFEGGIPQYDAVTDVAPLWHWYLAGKDSVDDLLNAYAPAN